MPIQITKRKGRYLAEFLLQKILLWHRVSNLWPFGPDLLNIAAARSLLDHGSTWSGPFWGIELFKDDDCMFDMPWLFALTSINDNHLLWLAGSNRDSNFFDFELSSFELNSACPGSVRDFCMTSFSSVAAFNLISSPRIFIWTLRSPKPNHRQLLLPINLLLPFWLNCFWLLR